MCVVKGRAKRGTSHAARVTKNAHCQSEKRKFSPFRFQISVSRLNLLHVLETTGIDSTGHTGYAINIHRQS